MKITLWIAFGAATTLDFLGVRGLYPVDGQARHLRRSGEDHVRTLTDFSLPVAMLVLAFLLCWCWRWVFYPAMVMHATVDNVNRRCNRQAGIENI
jgi:hypothetical protein